MVCLVVWRVLVRVLAVLTVSVVVVVVVVRVDALAIGFLLVTRLDLSAAKRKWRTTARLSCACD